MVHASDGNLAPGAVTVDAVHLGESQANSGSEKEIPVVSSHQLNFADEIDALKQKISELENLGAQSNPKTSAEAPTDVRMQQEMEQFKRMEACLYKHRKEWELNEGPGQHVGFWDYSDSRLLRFGNQVWVTSERGHRSTNTFERPDVFDPAHKCDKSDLEGRSRDIMTRDNYDDTIDWGDRRDRIRKNFEWDMDRMFLGEELQRKRKEKKRADEDRERRERRMAENSAPIHENQNTGTLETAIQSARGPDPLLLDWYPFKASSQVGGNSTNIVEVLVGEPVTNDNIDAPEYWFGDPLQSKKKASKQPGTEKLLAPFTPATSPIPERIRIHSDPLLRILSAVLGSDARSLLEPKEMEAVFLRPYKALVYREKALRDWCKALEKKFRKLLTTGGSSEDLSIVDVSTAKIAEKAPVKDDTSQSDIQQYFLPVVSEDDREDVKQMESDTADATIRILQTETEDEEQPEEDKVNDLTRSLTALGHLRCLLRFMDGNIVAKQNYLNSPECRKVFFSDLWHIFRPGVEVISSDGKQAYKVVGVSSAKHRVATRWERWYDSTSDRTGADRPPDLSLICVYIDFDGVNIGPVQKNFEFHRFDGQRDITSLEVYPLHLHVVKQSGYTNEEWEELEAVPAHERYRKKLIHRGARFLDVVKGKHMYYAGMTLETKDEVESPVVIDFETTFTMHDKRPSSVPSDDAILTPAQRQQRQQILEENMNNTWKPELNSLMDADEDSFRVSKTVCSGECCRDELVHDDQYVDGKQMAAYIEDLLPSAGAVDEHPPIIVMSRPMKEIRTQDCSDEELVIMSYRVFGFILRSRKFAKLDITYLSDIHHSEKPSASRLKPRKTNSYHGKKETEPTLAFHRLVLEKGHHEMIVSLIAQHFRDKKSATGHREEFDIVKGKGKGLIMLLHGAPGVGKTSTAEGVAEMFEKPLFQITCGDLGTTAAEVEAALEKNFSLANKWDCILLLDEADVFLAERTKEDFKRNGLVAVFLRLMEYYSGILFLTTNRVGDFDEAFTSRIHVSLYYPELSKEKTVQVFILNMDMIEERFKTKGRVVKIDRELVANFAAEHFTVNPLARWNGRQIRNACQTALALAEFEAQDGSLKDTEDPDIVVNLRVNHFKIVRDAYLEFTRYINELHGTNAARRAKEARLRAIWIDENDRIVKTQNMEAMDKKQSFFLASQNLPSRPQGHSPQNSFQNTAPPQPRYQQSYSHQPYQVYDRDPYQHPQPNLGMHQSQQHHSSRQSWEPQPEMYARGYTPEPQHGTQFSSPTPRGQHAPPSPHAGPQQQGRPDMPRFNEEIRNLYEDPGRQGHEQATAGAGGPARPGWGNDASC